MSSSSNIASSSAANKTDQALDQIESILKLFEEYQTAQAPDQSESLREDIAHDIVESFSGIEDSLTLSQYDILNRLDGISQQVDDKNLASSRSSTHPKRSGVCRGQQVGADPFAPVTLTVMTKTNDGASRGGRTSSFIKIDTSGGSSLSHASAA